MQGDGMPVFRQVLRQGGLPVWPPKTIYKTHGRMPKTKTKCIIMAAENYEIALGMRTAYFARKKKTKSNTMSEDRREITEGEVLMLIDFYAKNYCIQQDCNGISIDSLMWPGKKLRIEFVEK